MKLIGQNLIKSLSLQYIDLASDYRQPGTEPHVNTKVSKKKKASNS